VSFQFVKTRVQISLAPHPWPDADALVLPTNDYLWMASGPAGSVKRSAGDEVELAAVRAGPIPLGEVIVTPAGNLPFQAILHVAVMGQDLLVQGPATAQGLLNALRLAEQRRWPRLIVHSFVAAGRSARPEVAIPALRALVDELLGGRPVSLINLLASDDKEKAVLHDALLRIVQKHD
jgi:O-acetyl-ADP-ribose deacetylase (regulator of RNase III)